MPSISELITSFDQAAPPPCREASASQPILISRGYGRAPTAIRPFALSAGAKRPSIRSAIAITSEEANALVDNAVVNVSGSATRIFRRKRDHLTVSIFELQLNIQLHKDQVATIHSLASGKERTLGSPRSSAYTLGWSHLRVSYRYCQGRPAVLPVAALSLPPLVSRKDRIAFCRSHGVPLRLQAHLTASVRLGGQFGHSAAHHHELRSLDGTTTVLRLAAHAFMSSPSFRRSSRLRPLSGNNRERTCAPE